MAHVSCFCRHFSLKPSRPRTPAKPGGAKTSEVSPDAPRAGGRAARAGGARVRLKLNV